MTQWLMATLGDISGSGSPSGGMSWALVESCVLLAKSHAWGGRGQPRKLGRQTLVADPRQTGLTQRLSQLRRVELGDTIKKVKKTNHNLRENFCKSCL